MTSWTVSGGRPTDEHFVLAEEDRMLIRVFGPGCYRCQVLAENARLAVTKLGIDATIEEVHDLMQMVALGIITTPTLVVDGRVVMSGKVPSVEELQEVLGRSPVTA